MPERLQRNEGIHRQVAFMFSCPGSMEEKTGKLVRGATGTNLTEIIRMIREEESYRRIFPTEDRYDYRITNASNIIHYKAKDGISEPSNKEILYPENIERLLTDLRDFKVILTFGKKALFGVNACKEELGNPTIISVRHLGFQSLNQIKNDVDGKKIISNAQGDKNRGKENTQRRLRVIAKEIMDELIQD